MVTVVVNDLTVFFIVINFIEYGYSYRLDTEVEVSQENLNWAKGGVH